MIWFAKNPAYLGQAFHILSRRVSVKSDRHGYSEAIKWCQSLEIDEKEALSKITGLRQVNTLQQAHFTYFDYAMRQSTTVPITMGGAGAIDFIYQLSKYINAERILETGVAYGWSSMAFLLSNDKAKLYSIDMPYLKMNNEQYVGVAVHPDLLDRWTLLRMSDRKGIPRLIREVKEFDLIHYDSDKSYAGRRWAYPRLWEALRQGGYFISDDIQDNIAFYEFSDAISKVPYIFENAGRYVGAIQKE